MQNFKQFSAEGLCARVRCPLAAVAGAVMALCSAGVLAQTASASRLSETVVTAARMPQSLESVTADMTVIDSAEIERSGAVGVADVLARVPGVQINRSGGPGQATSVYLRGMSNQHAVVFVDGVRFGTQEMQGGAVWATLPLAQIERIEVLRGPAAAIYGSDAMGGVIQIFTRKGKEGAPVPYVELGYGTHKSSKAAAGISGGVNGLSYALNLADERSDGWDVNPGNQWAPNPDKDGYSNSSVGLNLGYKTGIHTLDGSLRYNRLKAQYDQSPAPFDDFDIVKTTTASVKWAAQWTGSYRSVVQLSHTGMDTDRHTSAPESAEGRSAGLLWQNIWTLGGHRFNVDYERTEDRLKTDYSLSPYSSLVNTDSKRVQNAIALGWGWQTGAHSFNAHMRHDDVRDQKSKTTGGVGYGLQINDSLRWVASAGTAFRTPTLYERFTGQSSPDLRPESSRNIETGLHFEQGQNKLSAVVYRNKIRDQITYEWSGSAACNCYRNWEKVELTGLTLSGSTRVAGWNMGGSLDFMQPKNQENDKLLPYRSKRMLKLYADTQLAGWTLGSEAQLYSQRQVDAENTQQLPGYGLVNLYAERALSRDWRLLARLNNVADKDYAPSKGYASAGRTFFVSLKWTPH
ncbi:TonB-dependent receptor domain-containing protein [Comamonas sp. GB3 AK4-5]|uniref:TonB-dependent receptor domain-containing protein n=1 Tax=Comamonas sp. GB3 AK4-5 TaxID=3231487 RepID=UPI00351F117F